ncbi:MAG: peptidase, partial [Mucilaginibacter sp.]
DRLISQTWKAPQPAWYKGELQRLVNNLTLKQLLTLAADGSAPESVRGIALLEISGLKTWMQAEVKTSVTNQKANLLFGLSQIAAFERNPGQFKPAAPVGMPDGSPIGED